MSTPADGDRWFDDPAMQAAALEGWEEGQQQRAENAAVEGEPGLTTRLAEVIRLLMTLDFDTEIKLIEAELLPVESGSERMLAARNRADRAELMRAFMALASTGSAIVGRLEDDTAGKVRSE